MLTKMTYIYLVVAILLIFFLIASLTMNNTKEKFTDSESYQSRLTVIDVFDAYLKRNPTPKEINHYSSLKNEQDILAAVMKDIPDNKSDRKKKTQEQEDYVDQETNKSREDDEDENEEHDENEDEEEDEMGEDGMVPKQQNQTQTVQSPLRKKSASGPDLNSSEIIEIKRGDLIKFKQTMQNSVQKVQQSMATISDMNTNISNAMTTISNVMDNLTV